MNSSGDYPYYNGEPVEISPAGWLTLVASVVVAFALLVTLPFDTIPLVFVPAIAFTGIPLITLAAVTRGRHGALFGRFEVRDLFLMIGFGVLTVLISFVVGYALTFVTSMNVNAVADTLAAGGSSAVVTFMIRSFIQLIGEELMTILPLLAVLWVCVRKLNLSRQTGVVIAVVFSTLGFAAVHLPTYGWNFIQCFGGIGSARLVLTAAYLVTKKLWVCAGAHILNDWTEFLLPDVVQAFGHVPIDTGV
ncbi:membrane protease YdiL (CAAX protease family) [Devosia sp. UYZn731]|uniref:CPBP family intramembrane glutamic endopeptidase n=1 Tax=Devosia sp. UYZn731 TaxID=3156345 RepID=UPI00339A69A2